MLNKYKNLKREEYELPASTEGILGLIRQILSLSGVVHKLIVESGRGVIVYREKDQGDLEEVNLSLDAALRGAEILEYSVDNGATSFEAVHDMCQILSSYNLVPVCWVTGPRSTGLLERWLKYDRGLPGMCEKILNIHVHELPFLSEDVLILCGAMYSDADNKDIVAAVKTNIEILEVRDATQEAVRQESGVGETDTGQAPDRLGSSVKEPLAATREVGVDLSRQRGEVWGPPSAHFVQWGMGKH